MSRTNFTRGQGHRRLCGVGGRGGLKTKIGGNLHEFKEISHKRQGAGGMKPLCSPCVGTPGGGGWGCVAFLRGLIFAVKKCLRQISDGGGGGGHFRGD